MLILVERMAAFLREHANGMFCDACLLELLDVSAVERVTRLTSALGSTAELRQTLGRCSFCSREKVVIGALPSTRTHPLDLLSHPRQPPWAVPAQNGLGSRTPEAVAARPGFVYRHDATPPGSAVPLAHRNIPVTSP